MQMSFLYASDFSLKNFCKLAKSRFWLWFNIIWETHKLTRYQRRECSYYIVSENKRKSVRVGLQLARADLIIHSQREIEVFFSTLKSSPFPLAQSIKLQISALVLSPCLIPYHRCEKSARECLNSHLLITPRDNIHTGTHDIRVDPRGYVSSGWCNFSKNSKIVRYPKT